MPIIEPEIRRTPAKARSLLRRAFECLGVESFGWFPIHTAPRQEEQVVTQLAMRGIESFTPIYKCGLECYPVFPGYVLAKISRRDLPTIVGFPNVIEVLGWDKQRTPLSRAKVRFLNADPCEEQLVPFGGLVEGQNWEIPWGPRKGLKGVGVREGDFVYFVVWINLINRFAAALISPDPLVIACPYCRPPIPSD